MNEKLLKCPFCGREAGIKNLYKLKTGKFLTEVICTKCMVKTALYVGEEEAINAWNTRVEKE